MLNTAAFATKHQLLILSTEEWTESSLGEKHTIQEYVGTDVHLLDICKHLSFTGSRVAGVIPADSGRAAKYILDKSPLHHRQFTLSLEWPFDLTQNACCWTVGGNWSTQNEPKHISLAD